MTHAAVLTPDAKAAPRFSLGLGLTNECNLACSFCYRDAARTDRLSLDEVRAVMERLPVRSVNLGTGENGMHPDFKSMLGYLSQQPIKLTITFGPELGDKTIIEKTTITFPVYRGL